MKFEGRIFLEDQGIGNEPYCIEYRRHNRYVPPPLGQPFKFAKFVDAVMTLARASCEARWVTPRALQHWLRNDVLLFFPMIAMLNDAAVATYTSIGPDVEQSLEVVFARYGHRPLPLAFAEASLALYAADDTGEALLRYLKAVAEGIAKF